MPELFIAGSWHDAADGQTREIACPATGELAATVAEACADDAVAAVFAAREAFDNGPWRMTSCQERGAILNRVADSLERDGAQVARLESLDTGKRLVESGDDVADVASVFRHYAGLAAVDSDLAHDGIDRGRCSGRSLQSHPWLGRPGRRNTDNASGGRLCLVHGRIAHRQARHGRRCGNRQESRS